LAQAILAQDPSIPDSPQHPFSLSLQAMGVLAKVLSLAGMLAAAEAACTTEITTVESFYAMKRDFDLIFDVRALNEYTGDGDAACNTAKANKCNMGHDPSIWMLTNANRTDMAVVYKVGDAYAVDTKIIEALKNCYGSQASTLKVAVSCHSGARSEILQEALVAAGFACGNMYNVMPGADGMYKANASLLVKGNTQKGSWSCAAAPVTPKTTPQEAAAAARDVPLRTASSGLFFTVFAAQFLLA